MANTLTNIKLPKNTWIDLYAVSEVQVGVQILVENTGVCDVFLAVQPDQPENDHDAFNIVKRNGDPLRNNEGDLGAWAFCPNVDGLVNVIPMAVHGFSPASASDISITERESNLISTQEFRNSLIVTLKSIDQELRLLNDRFEEANETDIDRSDV